MQMQIKRLKSKNQLFKVTTSFLSHKHLNIQQQHYFLQF